MRPYTQGGAIKNLTKGDHKMALDYNKLKTYAEFRAKLLKDACVLACIQKAKTWEENDIKSWATWDYLISHLEAEIRDIEGDEIPYYNACIAKGE